MDATAAASIPPVNGVKMDNAENSSSLENSDAKLASKTTAGDSAGSSDQSKTTVTDQNDAEIGVGLSAVKLDNITDDSEAKTSEADTVQAEHREGPTSPSVFTVTNDNTLECREVSDHTTTAHEGALVHPLSAQRSASPQEIIIMEGIFEPRPSTSRDSGINRLGGPANVNAASKAADSTDSKAESSSEKQMAEKRERLKILPRNSQYEKHPLLQIRSESGLSEFDLLLMERGAGSCHARAFSLEEPILEEKARVQMPHKLVPRSSQYERNILFEKTASGLSQLEQYLLEKEQEMMESSSTSQETSYTSGHSQGVVPAGQQSITTTESGIGTLSESSNVSDASPVTTGRSTGPATREHVSLVTALVDIKTEHKPRPMLTHSKSVPESSHPPRAALNLVPRASQYQQSHILQNKNDKGVSDLQSFLQEMEEHYTEEADKGKCSTKCTCKNANCSNCKMASSSPQTTTVTQEVDMVTRIEPKSNNKRVHFQRQDCVEMSVTVPEHALSSAKSCDQDKPAEGGVAYNGTAEESESEAPGSNNKTSAKNNKKPKTNRSQCILS